MTASAIRRINIVFNLVSLVVGIILIAYYAYYIPSGHWKFILCASGVGWNAAMLNTLMMQRGTQTDGR